MQKLVFCDCRAFYVCSDETLDNGSRILVNPCSARGLFCMGACMGHSKICNGVADCPSGADEKLCPTEKGL